MPIPAPLSLDGPLPLAGGPTARLHVPVRNALLSGAALQDAGLHNAAQQLASLTASIRQQLWRPAKPAQVAYVGGVFRSRILLERFRLMVEMENGNRCHPPIYGPAEGALLEAYRAVNLHPKLSGAIAAKLEY